MVRLIILISILLCSAQLSAQFTYFNHLYGSLTDDISESTANIEVVEDGYVIWGGGVNEDNDVFHFVRKYNLLGEFVNETTLFHLNQYVLSGFINSFSFNPITNTFIFINGSNQNSGDTEGYLIEFDLDLDTTFTRRFSQYAPFTYPIGFNVFTDTYLVVGGYGGLINSEGTFVMKLNFEGVLIWSEILRPEVSQSIYRNYSVAKVNAGYCIAGGNLSALSPNGIITTINETGEVISEKIILDEDELRTYPLKAISNLTNGELLLGTTVAYADVEESENPNVFWTKIRLYKFDPESNEIYWEQDYHEDFEMILGGVSKIIATPDGGALISGGRYSVGSFAIYTWLLKIDSEGNEEWFKEYTYEDCPTCENIGGEIELTADGGYIMAGTFANLDINPRNAIWIVKMDACGDVEWQECELVGLEEKKPKIFSVYPNPSAGRFVIESDINYSIASWSVYNLAGQKVAEGNTMERQTVEVDLNLPTGLYALELVQKNGDRENHKIQISK